VLSVHFNIQNSAHFLIEDRIRSKIPDLFRTYWQQFSVLVRPIYQLMWRTSYSSNVSINKNLMDLNQMSKPCNWTATFYSFFFKTSITYSESWYLLWIPYIVRI